jgi:uncharacterized RDD family membrane protein YckC
LRRSTSKLSQKPGKLTSRPGFFRRLAALVYDSLLLLAILFLATAIVLPLNAGKAFTSDQIFFPLYLLGVSFVFYGWFWTHGGQTLGLRAWNIRLKSLDQQAISWLQAAQRFFGGLLAWLCLGLGFMWIIIDKHSYTWYDYWSGTTVFFDDPSE